MGAIRYGRLVGCEWEGTRSTHSHTPGTARLATRVAFDRNFDSNVTKFAPHSALKSMARRKWTFDERVVLHRVATVAHVVGSNSPVS